MNIVKSKTYIAIPPGATLREQLKDLKMTQKDLAYQMGMSTKHISKLINGEVQLTPSTALKLESILGIPAEFWCNLESIYQINMIRAFKENASQADEKPLFATNDPEINQAPAIV